MVFPALGLHFELQDIAVVDF